MATDLFVYVDSVEGSLVILQVDWGCGHCLMILGADNDDDQIFLLCVWGRGRMLEV